MHRFTLINTTLLALLSTFLATNQALAEDSLDDHLEDVLSNDHEIDPIITGVTIADDDFDDYKTFREESLESNDNDFEPQPFSED